MIATTPILDHIVVLLSYSDLQNVQQRLAGCIHVVDGGGNTSGVTVNKLVLFADGSYLELVAFNPDIDEAKKLAHRWGRLSEGSVIDWAYTLPPGKDLEPIVRKVAESSPSVSYREPTPGGRTKPDGTELKWAVTLGQDSTGALLQPGSVPFWCLDRTPRESRVPYKGAVAHPCGARGVRQVEIAVPEQEFESLSRAYEAIHGAPATSEEGTSRTWTCGLDSPVNGEGCKIVLARSGTEGETGVAIGISLDGISSSRKPAGLLPGVINL